MKRLLLLACLLQAGTVAPMRIENVSATDSTNLAYQADTYQIENVENLPQFTYDSQATNDHYDSTNKIVNRSVDSSLSIRVKGQTHSNPRNVFVAQNEMFVYVPNPLYNSNGKALLLERKIDKETKEFIQLKFDSNDDYQSFLAQAQKTVSIASSVKSNTNSSQKNSVNISAMEKLTMRTPNQDEYLYNAQATEDHYDSTNKKRVLYHNDGSMTIYAQQKNKNVYSPQKEIRIDIPDLSKKTTVVEENLCFYVRADERINANTTCKIELCITSKEDYEAFLKLANMIKKKAEEGKKTQHNVDKKNSKDAKEFQNQQTKNWYMKVGLMTCASLLGAYIIYKQPSWFMGGIKSIFGSFRFPFTR